MKFISLVGSVAWLLASIGHEILSDKSYIDIGHEMTKVKDGQIHMSFHCQVQNSNSYTLTYKHL